jgi:antitoxin component HigA of HigAB toxin-antitoxin module
MSSAVFNRDNSTWRHLTNISINGRRWLTVEMIRAIHAAWSIPLECLIVLDKRAA